MMLNELAGQLGVEVRLEALAGGEDYEVRGGLCRVEDRLVAFVDRRLPPQARVRQLGRSLLGLDWEEIYLRPALREFLEELRSADTEME